MHLWLIPVSAWFTSSQRCRSSDATPTPGLFYAQVASLALSARFLARACTYSYFLIEIILMVKGAFIVWLSFDLEQLLEFGQYHFRFFWKDYLRRKYLSYLWKLRYESFASELGLLSSSRFRSSLSTPRTLWPPKASLKNSHLAKHFQVAWT